MDATTKIAVIACVGWVISTIYLAMTIYDLQDENSQLKVELTTVTANYNDLRAGYESASSAIDYKDDSVENIKQLLKQCQSDLISQRDKYARVEQIMANANNEITKPDDQLVVIKEVSNTQVKQSLMLINSELTKLMDDVEQDNEDSITSVN